MKKQSLGGSSLLAALIACLGIQGPIQAELKPPTEIDRLIAENVQKLLEQVHISHHRVDDTMSERLHREFLNYFDPMKMYFLASDIEEFNKSKDQLDDRVARGDLGFAFDVYKRYMERMETRTQWALEFAEGTHDFTVQDEVTLDPKAAIYAKDETESKDRWRQRIKYEILTLMVSGEKEKEARDRINRRYRNVKRRWDQVDTAELEEIFLTSLAASFDPHTSYMGPPTLSNFRIAIELSLEGIGAVLQSEDGLTIIKEIVTGGAADLDGRLKPGDKIVGAGQGEDGEIEDLENMKLSDVVDRIRGKAGTKVRLEVISGESQKRQDYTLVRQKVQLNDRAAKGTVIEVEDLDGQKKRKIGVIDLPSFYANQEEGAQNRSASQDVKKILDDFRKQAVDGVVVDLRMNGGGLLSEAISLTGLFIDEGPVVQVRDFARRVTPYMDDVPGLAYNGPLVVLVSKFSASASEIFAGAIQDYNRGIVVGDSSTHGKGTVQRVFELADILRFPQELQQEADPNFGAIKVTMQKFYRVNGQSTQARGVVSDIVLPSATDHEDFGESKLEYALDFDTIQPLDYRTFKKPVTKPLIDHLNQLSTQRQTDNEELVDLVRRKNLVHERRARQSMKFNEEILVKEHDELEEKNAEAKADGEKALDPDLDIDGEEKKDEKPFGTNPYDREVLTITSDLIRLSNSDFTAR